jgi:hypothetical protein
MNEDFLKLRSSIKAELMQKSLFRGSMIGGVGVIILFLSGAFLPVHALSVWGIPLFFLSMGLITFGMLPYRKLTRLEKVPDEILLSSKDILIYRRRGKIIFTTPLSSIKSCTYKDDESIYGIEISMKENSKTYFFPYFSQRSANLLISTIDQ